MSLRRLIVDCDTKDLNVTAFCAEHGISTWFFWDLRRRFKPGEEPVVGSRAPHRVANRTPVEVEDEIVALRKELAERGLDAGAETIWFEYGRRHPESWMPSASTIYRVLERRGFIVPEPRKAPKHAGRRFAAQRGNEWWQIDDTEFVLADDTRVKVINLIDDCSRTNVGSLAVPTCSTATAFQAVATAAAEWGWPESILRDNAKAFIALADELAHLGIGDRHSRPFHPQTCGKVERFHQTQRRYLDAQDPIETIDELQAHVDAFGDYYNWQRPHRGIDRRHPADVWNATPKTGPANRPLGARTEILHSYVRDGYVEVGRRYRIGLGYAYNGEHATIVLTGTNAHVFIAGRLVRHLTIDPTKRVQPRYAKPGRPKKTP